MFVLKTPRKNINDLVFPSITSREKYPSHRSFDKIARDLGSCTSASQ